MTTLPPTSANTVNDSVQNILDFVRGLIKFYEDNYPTDTKKRFFFATRLNYAVEPDAARPSVVPAAEPKSQQPERRQSTAKSISKNALKVQQISKEISQKLNQNDYKKKMGLNVSKNLFPISHATKNYSSSKLHSHNELADLLPSDSILPTMPKVNTS